MVLSENDRVHFHSLCPEAVVYKSIKVKMLINFKLDSVVGRDETSIYSSSKYQIDRVSRNEKDATRMCWFNIPYSCIIKSLLQHFIESRRKA